MECFDKDIHIGKLRRYDTSGVKHLVEVILDRTKECWKRCALCGFGRIYRNITAKCSQYNVPLLITPFTNAKYNLITCWKRFHTCKSVVSMSKKIHEKLKSPQEDNKEKIENKKLETVAVGDEKRCT